MLPLDDIIRTAVRETDAPPVDETYAAGVKAALASPDSIPYFTPASKPLSVVRFRALLQDTGFPAEVYSPRGDNDMSALAERWIGWGVEIPGLQAWARGAAADADAADALAGLSLAAPEKPEARPGVLLKIYEPDAGYAPASVVEVVGIVSQGALPAFDAEDGDVPLVPALHVLEARQLDAPHAVPPTDSSARASLVAHLSRVFEPADDAAGELLLLSLLARPERRAGVPLGQLALNVVRPAGSLAAHLAPLAPALVRLPLSLALLHSAKFRPKSDGTALTPGLLQLAPGTLLLVDEDALGDGGQLAAPAVRNLQALSELLQDQTLAYEYPYTSGVRIGTSLKAVVESQAKSLLPVDVALPAALSERVQSPSQEELEQWRNYLVHHSSRAHAEGFRMPDALAELIQDEFVAERQAHGGAIEAAERRLKTRMKLARLLALSEGHEVTEAVWRRAVALEEEVERRNAEREARRRETPLGQPTAPAANGTLPPIGTITS